MDVRNADAILKAGMDRSGKAAMNAYLDVLLRSNPKIFMEVHTMATKTRTRKKTFEEVFTEAGLLPQWNAEAEAKGKVKGKLEVARNLLDMKMPIEIIAQAVKMPVEEIQTLTTG